MEVKKKPGEHVAHAVPLLAVVNPALHEHCPLEPHIPLRQLQLEGLLAITGCKQIPEPVIPSLQVVQFVGHGWHLGPKNPEAQDSHDVPVNPEAHLQVPAVVHTPEDAQLGLQAEDWSSVRESEPKLLAGSWLMSGIESQTIKGLLLLEFKAAQTAEDKVSDWAASGVVEFPASVVDRAINDDCPE